jgi:hypothetical protein
MGESDHEGRVEADADQTHQHEAAQGTARTRGRLEGPVRVPEITVRQGQEYARRIDRRQPEPTVDACEPTSFT